MIQGVGRCSTPPSLQKGSLEMAMEDCRPTDADENACPNAPILDPLGPARQILKLLRWPIEAQHVHLGPGIAAVVMLRYHHISRGTACPNSCALGTARLLDKLTSKDCILKNHWDVNNHGKQKLPELRTRAIITVSSGVSNLSILCLRYHGTFTETQWRLHVEAANWRTARTGQNKRQCQGVRTMWETQWNAMKCAEQWGEFKPAIPFGVSQLAFRGSTDPISKQNSGAQLGCTDWRSLKVQAWNCCHTSLPDGTDSA